MKKHHLSLQLRIITITFIVLGILTISEHTYADHLAEAVQSRCFLNGEEINCFSTTDPMYEQAAKGLLAFLNSHKKIQFIDILYENSLNPDLPAILSGALVQLDGGGYILIAPSRDLTPVKAYSVTRLFEDLPPAVQQYFRHEMEANARAVKQQTIANTTKTINAITLSETKAFWDFLLYRDSSLQSLAYSPDTILLSTNWNQTYPFNKFTPLVNGVPTYVGCTNTAIAQLMAYHEYPEKGRGVVDYEWNDQTLKAVFFKTYNWAQMPDTLDASTPAWQADQVASLMSDIGVANYTSYGTSGSYARVQTENLIRHFGYSNQLGSMSNSDPQLFFDNLVGEIDAERPVMLVVPGRPNHIVVADGYASDGTGRKIHLNMGWGGSHNDFYYLDATIETGWYTFNTRPENLQIYFPIKPCTGADCDWDSDEGHDVLPVINTILPDIILPSDQNDADRIFLDIRVENDAPITIQVQSSNSTAVQANLEGSILTLSTGEEEALSTITIEAEATGRKAQKSFVVMTVSMDQVVGYGKTFECTGRFTDQAEIYEHWMILDGPCTITGNRGFSNQAFFTAVRDKDGEPVVGWNDEMIEGTFPQGVYSITATLWNPETNYRYFYEPLFEAYVLKVSCPDADDSIGTVAQLIDTYLGGVNDTYAVTYNPNEATSGMPPNKQVKNHEVNLTLATNYGSLARIGYNFTGWNTAADGTGTDYAAGGNYTNNAALTLYAKWIINQYTITFNSSGGSAISPITQDYETAINAPDTPTLEGFTFTGWEPAIPNTMPAKNQTLTALYDINHYTVSFADHDGTVLHTATVNYGSSATAPAAPTLDGYTFTGWDNTFDNITADITVTAQYAINQYTITFDSAGGSAVGPMTQDFDTAITPPRDPIHEGYTFAGWNPEVPATMPTQDQTLTAQWDINEYILTYMTGEHGTLTGDSSQVVTYGSDGTPVEAIPDLGYHFVQWTDGLVDNPRTDTHVGMDITVGAIFDITQFELSITGGAGTGEYVHDTVVTISADEPTKEQVFDRWKGDTDHVANLYLPNTTITMPPGPVAVKAAYKDPGSALYTLTVYNGTGSGDYLPGDAITVIADTTPDGKVFDRWTGDTDTLSNVNLPEATLIMPSDDAAITATYKDPGAALYTLTVYNGAGSGDYLPGATIAITADIPADSLVFDQWMGDTASIANINLPETTLVMPSGEAAIKAAYKNDSTMPYTLTVTGGAGGGEYLPGTDAFVSVDIPEGHTFERWYGQTAWMEDINRPDTYLVMPEADIGITARFKRNIYLLSYTAGENGMLKGESIQHIDHGADGTAVYAVPDEGYTFAGWSDNVMANPRTDVDITESVEVSAEFTIKQYTVTFNDHDGVALHTTIMEHGSSATAPADPNLDDYTFTGWDSTFNNVTANITVTAQYDIKTYTVTFIDYDNNTLHTQKVNHGDSAKAPTVPPLEGHTFTGWDKIFDNVTDSLTVTAQYDIKTYTVTFEDYDGTELGTDTVNHSCTANAPADPVQEGYTFTSWDTDFENVTGDITVTATYAANFEDGDGTADNPYILAHSSQLSQIRGNLASYFVLGESIDLDDFEKWQPIGTATDPFTGGFDGNGHTISNLVINDSDADYAGLFGYTDGAMIVNTSIDNADITGGSNVGGLVGYAFNTTISQCYVTGFINGRDNVGGLVGYMEANAEVSVSDSYANCDVSGESSVGGLVGTLGPRSIVEYAYAVGIVAGNTDTGGLVGYNNDDTYKNVVDSFWNTDVGPPASQGGIGKTTAEMMRQDTFTGWDFSDTWAISEGDSNPYLQWQHVTGTLPTSLILDGSDQTMDIGFDVKIIGTGAKETLNIYPNINVDFTAGDGDRVKLPFELEHYEITSMGNHIFFSDVGTNKVVAIIVTGTSTVGFADGATATLEMVFTPGEPPQVQLGGAVVGSTPLDHGKVESSEGLKKSSVAYNHAPDFTSSDLESLIDGFSDFTIDLYHALRKDPSTQNKNLFFSTYSIENALAMTWAGARSNTTDEMADALHLNLPQNRFHPTLNALNIDINSRGDQLPPSGDAFQLKLVNAIWSRIGYPLLPSYLDIIAENYNAGVRTLDFAGNPDGSRQVINQWVEDQTNDKIKDLLPPNSIGPLTTLVLTNAIYFKASWFQKFDEELTSPADFSLLDGSTVNVDMMNHQQLDTKFFHGICQ